MLLYGTIWFYVFTIVYEPLCHVSYSVLGFRSFLHVSGGDAIDIGVGLYFVEC